MKCRFLLLLPLLIMFSCSEEPENTTESYTDTVNFPDDYGHVRTSVEMMEIDISEMDKKIAQLYNQVYRLEDSIANYYQNTSNQLSKKTRELDSLKIALNEQLVEAGKRFAAKSDSLNRVIYNMSLLVEKLGAKNHLSSVNQVVGDAGAQSGSYVVITDRYEDILFEQSSDNINNAQLLPIVEQVKEGIKGHPMSLIHISGHTDSKKSVTETEFANQILLSKRRALKVRDFLRIHGIPEDKIVVSWYGPLKLKNLEVLNAPENRRVSLCLMYRI